MRKTKFTTFLKRNGVDINEFESKLNNKGWGYYITEDMPQRWLIFAFDWGEKHNFYEKLNKKWIKTFIKNCEKIEYGKEFPNKLKRV